MRPCVHTPSAKTSPRVTACTPQKRRNEEPRFRAGPLPSERNVTATIQMTQGAVGAVVEAAAPRATVASTPMMLAEAAAVEPRVAGTPLHAIPAQAGIQATVAAVDEVPHPGERQHARLLGTPADLCLMTGQLRLLDVLLVFFFLFALWTQRIHLHSGMALWIPGRPHVQNIR